MGMIGSKGGMLALACLLVAAAGTPCVWNSPSGVTFDLRPLTRSLTDLSYYILDGDLSCTVEEEPIFSYTWNFCAPVTDQSLPGACANVGKNGVALQYLEAGKESFCYIIGRFDNSHPDMTLLDPANPAKGVSIEYPTGERCSMGLMRRTIIDVECSDDQTTKTISAVSDRPCEYRMTMKSRHGCPVGCEMTDNGLCNDHGHCGYDTVRQSSYCYCNEGYYGDACEDTTNPYASNGYNGHSVQVWLLLILLIVAGLLVHAVIQMNNKIKQARNDAAAGYGQLPTMGDSSHDGIEAELSQSQSAHF